MTALGKAILALVEELRMARRQRDDAEDRLRAAGREARVLGDLVAAMKREIEEWRKKSAG